MLAMIALIKVIRSGGATVTAQCRLPAPQYPVPAQGRHIDHGPQPLALTERGDARRPRSRWLVRRQRV